MTRTTLDLLGDLAGERIDFFLLVGSRFGPTHVRHTAFSGVTIPAILCKSEGESQRKRLGLEAKQPFFVMWVDNAELLEK
jgi:hypothetical protein